jgi:hypothetical protein
MNSRARSIKAYRYRYILTCSQAFRHIRSTEDAISFDGDMKAALFGMVYDIYDPWVQKRLAAGKLNGRQAKRQGLFYYRTEKVKIEHLAHTGPGLARRNYPAVSAAQVAPFRQIKIYVIKPVQD